MLLRTLFERSIFRNTTSPTTNTLRSRESILSMSLRRSARVANTSTSTLADVKTTHGAAKYIKVEKPAAAPKKRKSRASLTARQEGAMTATSESEFSIPELPSTPLPKKRKAKATSESPAKPPPFTPTPSGIGLIASSTRAAPFPSLEHSPAELHATSAPLLTPGGSGIVALSSPAKPSDPSPVKRSNGKQLAPPDVGALKSPSTNIDTLLKEAEAYLISVDPKLRGLIEKHQCKMFSPEGLREAIDPFTALASSIMGQQVSGAAAASIRKKFTALFEETHPSFPSPAQVITKDLPTLRTAGLSQRKAEYISGLAEKFASGELSAEMLISASDEELIEKLVAVRGLGRWSVEMFACFGLKRMDVFSTGDLGVQRGMATYMGRDTAKLKSKGGKWKYMSQQDMLDLASKFAPYRSLFMWYMWRIEDVDVSVMQ
ncbi:DNA glycosylase [Ampelomyces quisqualis]|uniref:DNA glycosylase n=1 Tax=Ampelomyces quisqualis TaxID=50730 RepID=A0A6A5R1J6_AMPQU|nr:DNA glycosylase [Ampelomyces quisqualis]